ncbi:WD repeat-containing protein 54 isoform X4 [Vulpes lagopus]|uniref:WD repeat-containing protein 54 isoform X4 n=1 Tax=Vulpes lagopus TaxID=494514 RepID=UPI001BC9CD09|nr:WD repeat-containing protein 54 isoform X4 [Vulpes lagopus]
MFRRERSIPLRGSAAALCNNLSVLHVPARNLTHFGVVHGPSAQLLSAAPEGVPLAQRQLHAKEGAGVSPPLITQVHWCVLPFRVLLVLTSHRGIQMYESDGSVMVYWHALDSGDMSPVQAVFARGIASSGHFICVGTWSGRILVFDIPAKGPNIVLSEELAGHQTSVTDIATEPAQGQDCVADMVTADDSGLLCVWQSGPEFKLMTRIPGFGYGMGWSQQATGMGKCVCMRPVQEFCTSRSAPMPGPSVLWTWLPSFSLQPRTPLYTSGS